MPPRQTGMSAPPGVGATSTYTGSGTIVASLSTVTDVEKRVLSYANVEDRPRSVTIGGVLLLSLNVLGMFCGAALLWASFQGGESAALAEDIGLLFMVVVSVLFTCSLAYLDQHEGQVRPIWPTAALWTGATSVALAILNLVLAAAFR